MTASNSGGVGRKGHECLPTLNVGIRLTLNTSGGDNLRRAKGAGEMSWLTVENGAPICGTAQEQGDSIFLAGGWR